MGYRTKASTFFTEMERERIKVAAIEAEARTIGEVATVVIDRSSEYRDAEIVGGIFVGSLAGLVLSLLFFHASLWAFIPLSFVCSFPARFLFRKAPVLKRPFIGKRRRESAVRERAFRAFYERGLYKTKKQTGVLFFLSLLERKVWVIADKGIHGKIRQERLVEFAHDVSLGIKEGRACEALCEAIAGMGDLLWEYYPITDSDVDELPNRPMVEGGEEDHKV